MKVYDGLRDARSSAGMQVCSEQSAGTNFHSGLDWFDSCLPCGLPTPSSILVSGPSGTGKPYVGLSLAGAWLRQGGRVIFIPTHSSYRQLFERGLGALHGLSLEEHADSHFFVLFDSDMDAHGQSPELDSANSIRCNLVNPEVWREALELAAAAMEGEGPILVFASALNLVLLSPSYGEAFFSMLVDTIRDTRGWTYLLTISSSILVKKATILEQAADHLFRMERFPGEQRLCLQTMRIRGADFRTTPVTPPFIPELLADIKNQAVASRRVLIPKVSRI